LKFLSQADKPLELAYASKFGVDLGCVLFYLQRLASLYPEGCDVKQYCDFELVRNFLKIKNIFKRLRNF